MASMLLALARAAREAADEGDEGDDDTPGPAWQSALLASAVAAFALSATAVAALAAALVTAQQRAYTSAYAATINAAGGGGDTSAADSDSQDDDDPALLAGWRATAQQTARGIAATYTHELRAAAQSFLAAWLLAHGAGGGSGAGASQASAALALATFLRGWAGKRAQAKGAQVGATAASTAATAGAAAAVADILSGDVDDVDPDALADAGWGVVVLPEAGMCDLCATYAGNVYRLDDAPEVFDLFPAHPGCWHSAYLVPPDEVD